MTVNVSTGRDPRFETVTGDTASSTLTPSATLSGAERVREVASCQRSTVNAAQNRKQSASGSASKSAADTPWSQDELNA